MTFILRMGGEALDISRAQTLLNWSPSIPLEEGLRKTVAYFKEIAVSSQQSAISKQQTAGNLTE